MTKKDFENNYLNKQVEITLTNGEIYKLKAVNTLIENVMYYLNIKNYRYDVVDNILFIYEPIIIEKFVILKTILCNILIVIKRKGIMLAI